ncbi:MAG: hypothetical protein WB788_07050 [Thermoplasmata archaeon]
MAKGGPDASRVAQVPTRARRKRLWILVAAVVAVVVFAYVFVYVPVIPAAGPDGCEGCAVHYTTSLSCSVAGFGTSEWQGSVYFGCHPPPIP